MTQIPDRILAILDILDEESASIVVINNLPSISSESKAFLRTQFLSKTPEVYKAISTFLIERDLKTLLKELQPALQTAPSKKQRIVLKSPNIVKGFSSIAKNDLTISTDFNSKNKLNYIEQPKQRLLQLPLLQDEERNASNSSLRESSSREDSMKFTHTIITDNYLNTKESSVQEDTSSKTMSEDSKLLMLAFEHSEQENKPDIFRTVLEPPVLSSPKEFASQARKREQKIKETDSQFKMILEESKVFVQTRAFSPKFPHYQSTNTTLNLTHKNEKIKKDIRAKKHFDFSQCKPCNLTRINLPQYNVKKFGSSNAPSQDKKQFNHTLISEESHESCELEATPTTEELFKKYVLDTCHEEKKINPVLELSFSSMLRYIDFEKLMLKLKENSIISQIHFIASVREELRKQLKEISLSNESIAKLSQIYQIVFSPTPKFETCLGALSLLCGGKFESNLCKAEKYLKEDCTPKGKLRILVISILQILLGIVPNAIKSEEICIDEVATCLVNQFIAETHQDNVVKFCEYIQGSSKHKKKHSVLQPTILNESMEYAPPISYTPALFAPPKPCGFPYPSLSSLNSSIQASYSFYPPPIFGWNSSYYYPYVHPNSIPYFKKNDCHKQNSRKI